MASRKIGVAPSWILSTTGMLLALRTCEIIFPNTPPSVSILEPTTTSAARAELAAVIMPANMPTILSDVFIVMFSLTVRRCLSFRLI
ncbi:hypothetical protein D9M72_573830 [compost metagenome]